MAFVRAMYKKGTGNDKQGKDAGNRTLCPYRNFSQAIKELYCLTKISIRAKRSISRVFSLFIIPSPFFVHCPYLLFTNWVQGLYQEIQAQGFSYSPSLRGLFGKPRACISWYGTSTQLVNSLLHDPF